jgi:hypothetical protein
MDDHGFDQFAKALAGPVSRRQAVKLTLGAAAGGVISLVGARTAFGNPPCRPIGRRCNPRGNGPRCCSNYCDPATSTCACAPGTFSNCAPGATFDPSRCLCICADGHIQCYEAGCCAPGTFCGQYQDISGQQGFCCCPANYYCSPAGCVPA